MVGSSRYDQRHNEKIEEEEPTGYVTYDRLEKVAIGLLQDSTLVRDDEEKIFRAFKTL